MGPVSHIPKTANNNSISIKCITRLKHHWRTWEGEHSLGKHGRKRVLYKGSNRKCGFVYSLACHCSLKQMVSACGWTHRLNLEGSARERSCIELVRQV